MHNILENMFFVPVFSMFVSMLIFQIKRILSSEKCFNYVVTLLLSFLKMPKIWVGRTPLNGEKKRGWPYLYLKYPDNFIN